MSTPPYPPPGTRPPIKYVWPKRIAVILAGLAVIGGIGFGVKSLLPKDETPTTSQETVASASPAPAQSPAPPSPTTQASPTQPAQPAAQAPMRLEGDVTDSAGALSSEQTDQVKSALKNLQAAKDVRLWVVYVDAFDTPPAEWARKTTALTRMGDRDAILAVATTQRKYAFLVAPAAAEGSEQAINDMRRTSVEPKLRDGDWAGAAVAAATGLQTLG